jgi:hypothetical protein
VIAAVERVEGAAAESLSTLGTNSVGVGDFACTADAGIAAGSAEALLLMFVLMGAADSTPEGMTISWSESIYYDIIIK